MESLKIKPDSKFTAIRIISIILFFAVMLLGIAQKNIHPIVELISLKLAAAAGIFAIFYAYQSAISWNQIPLTSEKEGLIKLIIFYSVFMIALSISNFYIFCYFILWLVLLFKLVSKLYRKV